MQWEFTSDYATCRLLKDEAGKDVVTPTVRFQFVRHFCNLTPLNAEALTTTSDNPKVLCTAFAGEQDGRRVHTLHLANFGAERTAQVAGLPAEAKQLRTIVTDETRGFEELPPLAPKDGALELTLPAMSLTTLTTMP
jgi:hypothetical protein